MNKIKKIQEIYGKGGADASLEECAAWLRSIGYTGFAGLFE